MSQIVDLPVRSSDAPGLASSTFDVVAAGAVPWRVHHGELQVLLIHRPKYNDWSFPKGKLDEAETVAECAVREVAEEVGVKVRLGLPLPAVTYEVPKGTKVVFYWATKVRSGVSPDGVEVDEVRWMSVEKAADKLSNDVDREPLDALRAAFRRDSLETVALVLARHAKAKPRAGWTREEGLRPLATSGHRQATSLAKLLNAWRPERVVSSPWRRCVQTMAPYAALRELQMKTIPALTEHSAARHPRRAAKVLTKQLAKPQCIVLCTHRPVLPALLPVLSDRARSGARGALPHADPFLRPGAILVAQRRLDDPSKIVSFEIHEPFDD